MSKSKSKTKSKLGIIEQVFASGGEWITIKNANGTSEVYISPYFKRIKL